MGLRFQFWNEEERQAVAEAVLALLARTGVKLTEPEARALLHGAGARVEGDRVRLPPELVRAALRTAPSSIAVFGRDGRPAMVLGGSSVYLGAHADAPDVWDPHAAARRACREADVAANARLIDALPRIAFATASGLVADRPAVLADRVSLAACLANSTKPVLAMPVTLDALDDCRRMAAAAAGGDDTLRARPALIVYAEPVSPLVHPDESIRKLLYCADCEVPVVYSGYAAMGATGPQSASGIVAQLCAESLSGLVIHQLRRPGAPFIFGGMASLMDMRTAVFSYGAPEFQRGNALLAEMAHHFGLPNFGTAGTSDAQVLDGQVWIEVATSCLMALLSGANLVHDVGLLGGATWVAPEAIVATDEVAALVAHLVAGVPVADAGGQAALALDAATLDGVGPGGEFVTHPHTLRHFREVWYPTLLFRGGARGWGDGLPNFEQRVNARTRTLLETHRPEPLPDAAAGEIETIVRRAEARL